MQNLKRELEDLGIDMLAAEKEIDEAVNLIPVPAEPVTSDWLAKRVFDEDDDKDFD
jgi:hypothetical protein